jgi:hypothetical protein
MFINNEEYVSYYAIKSPAYVIKLVGTEPEYQFQLIGIGHMGNGKDALYLTGTLEECKERFFENTKKVANKNRILYVECIMYHREI